MIARLVSALGSFIRVLGELDYINKMHTVKRVSKKVENSDFLESKEEFEYLAICPNDLRTARSLGVSETELLHKYLLSLTLKCFVNSSTNRLNKVSAFG